MPTEFIVQDKTSGKFAMWSSAPEEYWTTDINKAHRVKSKGGANSIVRSIISDATMIHKLAEVNLHELEKFVDELDCQVREVDIILQLK